MRHPGETSDSGNHSNGSTPLPLFRPEALLYQRQKTYGEIVLIRPLSLTLLTWMVAAIVAGMVGVFTFGHYTEKAHVPGRLVSADGNASGDGNVGGTSSRTELQPKLQPKLQTKLRTEPQTGLRAELEVPVRWLPLVQPGTRVLLRCGACPADSAEQTGTVSGISDTPMEAQEGAGAEPARKVTVSLPSATRLPSSHRQAGVKVVAEIPLGRKPFIQWFFERAGS